MQPSDHRERETEGDEVGDDVGRGIGDPVRIRVNLPVHGDVVVPPTGYGPDGEEVGEEEADAPRGDHGDDDVDDLGEAVGLEEALVEEQDGDFDAGDGDDIEELEGEVCLYVETALLAYVCKGKGRGKVCRIWFTFSNSAELAIVQPSPARHSVEEPMAKAMLPPTVVTFDERSVAAPSGGESVSQRSG